MEEKVSVRMDIGHGHACWRVWIFGSGKSNGLEEREDAALHKILCNGCLLGRRIATFSPSLSLTLPDFNCLWQRTLAALQFDELQS